MKWPKNGIFLTLKERDAHTSTNWEVTVADDNAKCEIGYGENENKNKFRCCEIDFTARRG